MKNKILSLTAIFLMGSFLSHAETVTVDPTLPTYAKVGGVSGNLNSIGSDTLNNLMTFWAEGFKANYPNVNVQIEGKGSSTAPPALTEGTSQLGPMSRAMKDAEASAFEQKTGYKPTPVKVAIDALAVFVHKDNPIECLALDQVDSAFSSTFKRGGASIDKWGALGLANGWEGKPISLYGRNSASGTYGFFKEHALKNGDYKTTVKEQPGSSSVVQGISSDLNGIGYSGIGYKTAGVKAVKLKGEDGTCYEANLDNALSGKYPLARFLYVYLNKAPGKSLDALVGEFMKYALSKDGQNVVVKDGYFPLPSKIVTEESKKLGK